MPQGFLLALYHMASEVCILPKRMGPRILCERRTGPASRGGGPHACVAGRTWRWHRSTHAALVLAHVLHDCHAIMFKCMRMHRQSESLQQTLSGSVSFSSRTDGRGRRCRKAPKLKPALLGHGVSDQTAC